MEKTKLCCSECKSERIILAPEPGKEVVKFYDQFCTNCSTKSLFNADTAEQYTNIQKCQCPNCPGKIKAVGFSDKEYLMVCSGCGSDLVSDYNGPMVCEYLDFGKEEKKSALDIQEGGDHYKNQKIQPIEYIMANNLGFCEGNVVKYVTRYKQKNGLEDLKKARHYLDFLIEDLGG